MLTRQRRWAVCALLLGLAASGLVLAAGGSARALWSDDGLFYQPRLRELELGRAYGFAPGTTPWRDAALPESLDPEDLGSGRASPGALLLALAAALGLEAALGSDSWELSLRVADAFADETTGALLAWGFQDDAVAGADWRLSMRRGETGWRATALSARWHCRRGVSAEGLCL